MRKLRIVLGSNDGESLINDHMGEAETFYLFDLFEDGHWEPVAQRKNTSPREEEGQHGSVEKLRVARQIFKDADVVLARRGSPNFIRMRDTSKFQPVVSRLNTVDEALAAMAGAFDEIYALVMRRRQGERPRALPILRPQTPDSERGAVETVAP